MSSRYWSVADCCWRSSAPGPDPQAERWTTEPATTDPLPATPDLADAVPTQRGDAQPVTA